MTKRPSLAHQMWQVLECKKAIGESRHVAKLRLENKKNKINTIHSYKTYEAYKQSSKSFCKWLKLRHSNIKYISEIDKHVCIEYIKYREQLGLSAYTYSQDMAMISKCLDISLTKKECNVKNRSLKKIKNNRESNGFKTNSQVIETIIKGSGLRRNELLNLKRDNLLESGKAVTGIIITKGAKGGRSRVVQIRKEFQTPIYNIIKKLDLNSKVINEDIPKKLQTHRLRAEYAQNMYKELVELGRENPLIDLTQSMGHNRVSVLVHYGIKV